MIRINNEGEVLRIVFLSGEKRKMQVCFGLRGKIPGWGPGAG